MNQAPLNPLAQWVRNSIIEGVQAAIADMAGGVPMNGVHNGHALPPAPAEPEALPPVRRGRKPGPKPTQQVARKPRKRIEPPAPPPDMDGPPLPKGEKSKQQRRAVAAYLSKNPHRGSAEIARECGIPDGSITAVLAYHWFERDANRLWSLTRLGREEFFDEDRGD